MGNSDPGEFRAELRDWLAANAPESLRGKPADELTGVWGGKKAVYSDPDEKLWLERAAQRGLCAPTWPREYGGAGLSTAEAKVLAEEMRRLRLPPPLVGFGLTMIGPTLLRFGSEELKRAHLPRIARGEIRWCQGYSEPGAGSDLASLQMRARRDGDHFVINGQKVWTSYAQESDWIFALVRSNPDAPKHEGITFLLIDMDDPGVTVKPILLISGSSPFCETFFQDVRVPVANVIGEIDSGWTVAKALLGHERAMIANVFGSGGAGSSAARHKHSAAVQLALRRVGDGERVSDAGLRSELAQLEMDQRCFGLATERSADAAKAGHQPGSESSFFKLYGTELNQRRSDLMTRILGPEALGWEIPGFEDEELQITRDWLRSRGNTIEGGTSEVQLNIIAKRVLGLPD
jgi:alkylation response protein AidB-like acyl-CoA dehydrogenase